MNFPEAPAGKSPRKELQGPRPTPLKVRKDSHKIRKPPVAPQHHNTLQQHQPQPPRPPVIIYTVSPKVIHANPNEFMTLVQRLTGPNSTCSSSAVTSSSSSMTSFYDSGGAISPAARFASVEKTKSPEGKKPPQGHEVYDLTLTDMVDGIDMISNEVERTTGLFPGILSPNPASLPAIPPNFFSPPADPNPNPLGFFYDLSPVLHSNKNYIEGSNFLPSPSNFLSPHLASPNTQSLDLFNNFFDF